MSVCTTSQKEKKDLKHSSRYEFRIVMKFRAKWLNLRITVSRKKVYESAIIPNFLKFSLQQEGMRGEGDYFCSQSPMNKNVVFVE